MNYTGFNTDDSKTDDWMTFWHRAAAVTVKPNTKVEGSKTERATEIIKRMSADSTGDLDSLFETPHFITITLPDSAT
jgi:hypothetical protein